jgi:hypothetical protein
LDLFGQLFLICPVLGVNVCELILQVELLILKLLDLILEIGGVLGRWRSVSLITQSWLLLLTISPWA